MRALQRARRYAPGSARRGFRWLAWTLARSGIRWVDDGCTPIAAAVAFFPAFSLARTLVIVLAVAELNDDVHRLWRSPAPLGASLVPAACAGPGPVCDHRPMQGWQSGRLRRSRRQL
jgi:hypothetical protein